MCITPAEPQFALKRITSSAAISAGIGRIMAVILECAGDSDNGGVRFYNAASASGTPILELSKAGTDSPLFDFTRLGGVKFNAKCFASIDQLDALYVWYDGVPS